MGLSPETKVEPKAQNLQLGPKAEHQLKTVAGGESGKL